MDDDWPIAFRRRPKAKIDTIRLRIDLERAATPRLLEEKTGLSCKHISPWKDPKTDRRIGNGSDRHWLVVIEDPKPETWLQTVEQLVDGCARWGLQQRPVISSFDIALDWGLKDYDKVRNPEAADRWSWSTAELLVRRLLRGLEFNWRASQGELDVDPEGWRFEAIIYKTFVAIQEAKLQRRPYSPIEWQLSQTTFSAGNFDGRDKLDRSFFIPDENGYRVYFKTKDQGESLDRADWVVRLECRLGPLALGASRIRNPQDLLGLQFQDFKGLFPFLRVDGQDAEGAVVNSTDGKRPRGADSHTRRKISEALEALSRQWQL